MIRHMKKWRQNDNLIFMDVHIFCQTTDPQMPYF